MTATSSVGSNATTAWHTALTNAQSASSGVSHDANGRAHHPPAGQNQQAQVRAPLTWASVAQAPRTNVLASASAANYLPQPQNRPTNTRTSSYSSAASSSSPSERSISSTGSVFNPSRAPRSSVPSQNSSGSRWRGAANVRAAANNISAATTFNGDYDRQSESSSRASSPRLSPQHPRSSSQSGLSSSGESRSGRNGGAYTSRSQTSYESDQENPQALVDQGIANANSYLRREALPPRLVDYNGWDISWRAQERAQSGKADDEDQLAADIAALGLDRNLREKQPPKVYSQTLPPPPSDKAWTLRKDVHVEKGSAFEPTKPNRPSEEYMQRALTGSQVKPASYWENKRPKLLVLDVNKTLVTRKKASKQAARNATPRPFLSPFLEYICGHDEVRPGVFQKRFNVMVWSSAEPENVMRMCETMCLVTNAGEGSLFLEDIWGRDSMDLTLEQYNSKFPTVKDLSKIWNAVPFDPESLQCGPGKGRLNADDQNGSETDPDDGGESVAGSAASSLGSSTRSQAPHPRPSVKGKASSSMVDKFAPEHTWSQHDTILIDDSRAKAVLQPYNHLCIPSWEPPTRTPQFTAPSHAYGGMPKHPNEIKVDEYLLTVIGLLDRLKKHTNVSSAIAHGSYRDFDFDGGHAPAYNREGRDVLARCGIKVKYDFDPNWANRVRAKIATPVTEAELAVPPGQAQRVPPVAPSITRPLNIPHIVGWE